MSSIRVAGWQQKLSLKTESWRDHLKRDLRKRFPKKRDVKTGKMKRVSRGLQLACFSERSVPLLGTNSANIVNNSNIQILTIQIFKY